MPFVKGFLKTFKPGHRPGQGLPKPERPVDPDWGIEEGGGGEGGGGEDPEVVPPIWEVPEPPPGVWPGPSVELPWVPVPPGDETEPGTLWPSPGTPEHPIKPGNKLWILVAIPGHGYKYVCVDAGLLVPGPGQPLPK